ncbi:MAG TPA: hypothetical protein VF469_11780 [Kofleriaceae bacterium]
MAIAGPNLWLASGPFVFHRSPAGLTTLSATQAVQMAERAEELTRPPLAPIVLTPLAITTGGVFGAAAIHGESHGAATTQVLAGSAAAIPGAMFFEFLDDNPCVTGNDSGYQVLNDIACVVRGGGYLAGIVGAGALGGAGAYEAGQATGGSSTQRAFAGAWTGGMIGSAASLVSTKLMHRYVPKAGATARTIVAAALMDTGAALGYQLAQ